MIDLTTGVPGSGKTLLLIELIYQNFQSEQIRPLFSNVAGLDFDALRCFPLPDPEKWYDLPDGCIIVIDECQRWFPPRANGSAVPEHIKRFETHRHQGLDIYLITQHPKLIDVNLRKLAGRHRHCYRPFGMKQRTVLEWNSVCEEPEPNNSTSTALSTKVKFDESLFKYYKSATVHTHKTRMPWKKIAVLVVSFLFAIACFGGVGYSLYTNNLGSSSKTVPIPAVEKETVSSPVASPSAATITATTAPGQTTETGGIAPVWLKYTGYLRTLAGLDVMLEDATTGQAFRLTDFTGYRREGIDTVFYVADGKNEFEYRARDRELFKLLP